MQTELVQGFLVNYHLPILFLERRERGYDVVGYLHESKEEIVEESIIRSINAKKITLYKLKHDVSQP